MSAVAMRSLYVSASQRFITVPSAFTMKIDGHAISVSASKTPNALMPGPPTSESSGNPRPRRSARTLLVGGSSTEIATSPMFFWVSVGRFDCSSPSCVRQYGHQSPR
jgi:hypothetical protein